VLHGAYGVGDLGLQQVAGDFGLWHLKLAIAGFSGAQKKRPT